MTPGFKSKPGVSFMYIIRSILEMYTKKKRCFWMIRVKFI